jgi:hypothetical protein
VPAVPTVGGAVGDGTTGGTSAPDDDA